MSGQKYLVSSNNAVGIIGAMPQEVEELRNALQNSKELDVAGMTLYAGYINNKEVIIMQSGIGKVNASIATTLMIERFNPAYIINTGSAGGLCPALNIGDVVVANSVIHHDVDLCAFGYKIGQMAKMPEDYICYSSLVLIAKKSARNDSNINVYSGQIASGDQFIADKKKIDEIKKYFPNTVAIDMESASIAQTCYHFKVPFVIIRAISDLADEKASTSFDTFIEKAGRQSAKMVINILGEL